MTKAVPGNDRLALSALADRLIYADPTVFSADDAIELASLLPVPPGRAFLRGPWPGLIVKGSMPGRSGSGFAAGVGNVSMPQDEISFDFDSRGRRMIRAGQWKLFRYHNAIGIEQVMSDDTDDGRAALLEFKKDKPARMLLMVQAELSIGPISIGFGRYKPWKLPG